jgi:hypothetical protein
MQKKIVFVLELVFLCCAVFAEGTPKKVLSARDVDAFIANNEAITADLDRLGDKYNDYFDVAALEGSAADPAEVRMAIANLRATKVPGEVQSVFKKNGMGDNGFEKYIVIVYGYGSLYFDKMLREQLAGKPVTPEMRPYVDQAAASVDIMKASVHKDDLSLLSSRLNDLIAILETSAQ